MWTQSFKAGKRGTGGETGRRGVTGRSLTSLHESHSEDDRERGYRTPSATLCGSEVTGSGWFPCCTLQRYRNVCENNVESVEFETEVNSSEWSRFGAYPS